MRVLLCGMLLLGLFSSGFTAFAPYEAKAQQIILPCVPSGASCIPVSAANPLPTTGGGGGGGITAGATVTGCTANFSVFVSTAGAVACSDTQFMLSPSGTAANPGLTGGVASTTGLYWPGAGQFGISVAGTNRMDFNSSIAARWHVPVPFNILLGAQLTIADVGLAHGLQMNAASGALNIIGTLGAGETLALRVASVANLLLTGTLVAIGPAVTAANTFPALKRVTTTLAVRLADDSADAPISASSGTFSGALSATLATALAANVVCNAGTASSALTLQVSATGCAASSARFKEGITSLNREQAFNDVLAFEPYSYFYRPEFQMGSDKHVGFTAEQIGSIDPQWITYEADGVTPHAVKYNEMVPLLVAAFQQLNDKFEAYKRSHP